MEEFLNKLNIEAENLANKYESEEDCDVREDLLVRLDLRLSILAHAQALKTSSITADFTQQMQEQAKNIDFSKINFNDLVNQLGNLK